MKLSFTDKSDNETIPNTAVMDIGVDAINVSLESAEFRYHNLEHEKRVIIASDLQPWRHESCGDPNTDEDCWMDKMIHIKNSIFNDVKDGPKSQILL